MIPVREEDTNVVPSGLTHPNLAYTGPFVVFLALMAIISIVPFHSAWEYPVRIVVVSAAIFAFSRRVLDFNVARFGGSVGVGAVVFAIWIAPDLLLPGYRSSLLFQNPLTGAIESSIPSDLRGNELVLFFRAFRAVIIVPIVEELFWRGWLMRWLIRPRFWELPLGAVTASSMWISAILFASEHGPFWDVGLLAGLIYNFWMVRTKSLGDCILAHAVTNALLSIYVLASGRWEYWL